MGERENRQFDTDLGGILATYTDDKRNKAPYAYAFFSPSS